MTAASKSPNLPPLTVILGPARSGKTMEALARLRATEGPCTVIVPSSPFAERLKAVIHDTLGDDADRFTVEPPNKTLEKLCGAENTEKPLSSTVTRLLVAELCRTELASDGFFGTVMETPGFHDALAELIGELKRSRIVPTDLDAAARAIASEVEDPLFARKVAEVVRVYAAYEQRLAAGSRCDDDDLPRIASERVAANPAAAGMRALAVIGFHRLSAALRDLLGELARSGVRVVVTLPSDESRPILFATTHRTLQALRAQFAIDEVRAAGSAAPAPTMLARLERGLWGVQPSEPPATEDGSIRLFDAPNPYTEAEMVAREICREHYERDTPWNRCAILARSVADNAPVLAAACEKLGVPLDLRGIAPLSGEPEVRRLIALLDMVARDWQREDVIAFVKVGAGPGAKLGAEWLRRKARRAAVREGRSAWQCLIAGDDAQTSALARALQWDAELRLGARAIVDWVDALKPIVAELLPPDEDAEGREHPIGQVVRDALTDYVRAAGIAGRGSVSFDTFRRELVAILESTTAPQPPRAHADLVAVRDANESRERDVVFAAVMGLVEKSFPRRVNEDPFFRDDEREALARAGLDLEPRRHRADEERLLFYMNATAPSERLVFSYPRASAESDALRSFYLDEVEFALGGLPTTMLRLDDVAPRPEDCVSSRDRLLAACARIATDVPLDAPADTTALRALVEQQGLSATDADLDELARLLASRSLPHAPRLTGSDHVRAYASPRPYRVTEIEAYRQCPFRHFAQYALHLHEDEEGVTPAELGDLYHRVLREVFRKRAPGSGDDAAAMREALLTELGQALAESPVDAPGFRRRLSERGLTDALAGFAEREERFHEAFAMEPAHFELAFGPRRPGGVEEDGEEPGGNRDDGREDPASVPRPLGIDVAGGGRIELCGTIDRVDLDADGRRAMVLDYKLGGASEFKEIEAGDSIQLPLYMLAAEQVFHLTAAAAAYDTPRETGRPRFFRRQHTEERRMAPVPGVDNGRLIRPLTEDQYVLVVETARQVVRASVVGITRADVIPTPGDYCDTCPYSDLCRTTTGPSHDGEPLPIPATP